MSAESGKLYSINQLISLIKIASVVNSSLNTEEILKYIIDSAVNVVKSEASSMLLLEENEKRLYFRTVVGPKAGMLKSCSLRVGEGIAGWVVENGVSARVNDAKSDPRHCPDIDQSTGFITQSVLCVPMKCRDRIIGALEVINKSDREIFTEEEEMLLIAFADQAALAIENARLYQMAIKDELTGLYSYRYFQDIFQREKLRSSRHDRSLTLIVLDLDDFKKINDTYGHRVGDSVLKEFSGILQSNLRSNDVIARYGGEEFVVLLPEVGGNTIRIIVERLKNCVENFNFGAPDHIINMTASFGVATYPAQVPSVDELFFAADHAMYQSKAAGKNEVTYYQEP